MSMAASVMLSAALLDSHQAVAPKKQRIKALFFFNNYTNKNGNLL
jgi:hypothetical protein